MRGDRWQIQTAVLGGAGSEEPLTLPLEAIEWTPSDAVTSTTRSGAVCCSEAAACS